MADDFSDWIEQNNFGSIRDSVITHLGDCLEDLAECEPAEITAEAFPAVGKRKRLITAIEDLRHKRARSSVATLEGTSTLPAVSAMSPTAPIVRVEQARTGHTARA